MKVLLEESEKERYRAILDTLFDRNEELPADMVSKDFSNREQYNHDCLGSEELFDILVTKFSQHYPQFCIATDFEDHPIILFDMRVDSINEFYGIMHQPKDVGLSWPDPDIGLYLWMERLYFFNPDKHWCMLAHSYYEEIILAY